MTGLKDQSTAGCASCHNKVASGLQCDSCNLWWCISCVNEGNELLTRDLYKALTKIQDFPWCCPNCDERNLLQQLITNETFSKEELLHLGCNIDVIEQIPEQSDIDSKFVPKEQTVEDSSRHFTQTHSEDMAAAPVQQDSSTSVMMQMMDMFMKSQDRMFRCLTEMEERRDQKRKEELHSILDSVMSKQQSTSEKSGDQPVNNQMMKYPSAKLPKTELIKFDGDMLKWNNFWESFDINVNCQTGLSDKQKLDYLHQVLQGPAYDKIKGLGYEGNKYNEAITILKKFYGNASFQEKAHWQSLKMLPCVKDNLSNLEKFIDDVRAIVISLKRQQIKMCVRVVLKPLTLMLFNAILA